MRESGSIRLTGSFWTTIRDNLDNLAIGSETGFHHCRTEPGKNRCYVRRESDRVFIAYCHHCGYRARYRLPSLAYSTTNRADNRCVKGSDEGDKQESRASIRGAYLAAHTLSRDWPKEALGWLYRYGLTDDEINQYGIRYNARTGRVALPIHNNGELQLVLERRIFDLDRDAKKYRQWIAVDNPIHTQAFGTNSDLLVLVEDYLSAVKLSRYTSTFPLLGVSLKTNQLVELLRTDYKRMVVWLDDDNTVVRRRQRSLRDRLAQYVPTSLVRGIGKDPKECTRQEIQEILKL